MLRRQERYLLVIPSPPDRDALVIDVIGPLTRVAQLLAHRVADPAGVDHQGIRLDVADLPSDVAHDLFDRPRQRLARRDATIHPNLVAPGRHLDLAVGAFIDAVALGDDGVGHRVAELVRVAGQHGLAHPDHAGILDNWV